MKRSELVRQLNLLPDVEVKGLENISSFILAVNITQVYISNYNEIVIDTGLSVSVSRECDQPKSNKFE